MRAVIVQARLTSTRLPGKVMLPLGGETVLWQVLQRCHKIKADIVVCAIPEGQGELAVEAKRSNALVIEGPEDDVLERYRMAAEAVEADTIIRVTSDCPLIDPKICDKAVKLLEGGNFSYVSNVPRTWPHGLEVEAFTRNALGAASFKATDKYDREHVGPWMRKNMDTATFSGPVSNGRWVLDCPEDYYFLKALFEYLPSTFPSYEEIQTILDRHPEISSLNALRRERNEQKADA